MEKEQWQLDAEAIMRQMNSMSFRADKIAKAIVNDHPTLQQSFFRLVLAVIWEMAENKYTDMRNEDSVKIASKIKKALIESGNGTDNYPPNVRFI